MARLKKQSQQKLKNNATINNKIKTGKSNIINSEENAKNQVEKKASPFPNEQVEMDYKFDDKNITQITLEPYMGRNAFILVMILLAVAILWSGVNSSMQIQKYRQNYKTLQEMKQRYLQLQVEHKRLLIEQQTFSATPQIATRAVSELHMFFPSFQEKRILKPQNNQTNLTHTVNQNTEINHTNKSESAEVNQ